MLERGWWSERERERGQTEGGEVLERGRWSERECRQRVVKC